MNTILTLKASRLIPILLCFSVSSLKAEILRAGDILRITFTTPSSYIEKTPTSMNVALGYVNVLEPYTTTRGSLYNGDTLLGVSTSRYSFFCSYTGTMSYHPFLPSWKAATSPWAFPALGDPAVVDFTPILNGTINGRIDLQIAAGSVDFNPSDVYMSFMRATYANGGETIYPAPTITSINVIPGIGSMPADLLCQTGPLPLPVTPSPPPVTPPPPPPVTPPPPAPILPPLSVLDDDPIQSIESLRNACEYSEGNSVRVNHSTTFTGSATISVGCNLTLGSGVTLGFDNGSVAFAGPLTMQSSSKVNLKLTNSELKAPAISINFNAIGSQIASSYSTLNATHQTLFINLGGDAKLEVKGSFSGESDSLAAYTKLEIKGNQKFLCSLTDARLSAPQGLKIEMINAEGMLKTADDVQLASSHGSVEIIARGQKGLVELKKTDILFGTSATIRVPGQDSNITLGEAKLASHFADIISSGAVVIEAGSATAANGKIEAVDVQFEDIPAIMVRASPAGSGGMLKVEKSVLDSRGSILLEGSSKAEAKDNTITSGTQIRITGPSCTAESNQLLAPNIQACP